MTEEPLWLKNGEKGLSAAFEESGRNWLRWKVIFSGHDLFIEVAPVYITPLIREYAFKESHAWFHTVKTNVDLPYAGVSDKRVYFLATVDMKPIEVAITGIKDMQSRWLEDGLNDAVARMVLRPRRGVRVPAVIRKDRELSRGPVCTACGGPLEYMGTLGKKEWYRCRNCGMESYKDVSRRPRGRMPSVAPQTGSAWATPDRKLRDRLEQLRKSDPDGFYKLVKQIRQEIKTRERGRIKMFPDIGLIDLRNVLKEAERMYR